MYNQPPEFVVDFFKEKTDLFFVDIGANDGIQWSNTYILENTYNWNGICIEPHPSIFKALISNRSCECLNIAISDTEEEADFFTIEGTWEANMLSGLIKNYDSRHWNRITEEYKRYNGIPRTEKVKVLQLQTVLDKKNIKKIDYLSVDTEGSEVSILKSIDFNKVEVTLISVEQNYEREPFDEILTPYGYKFLTKVACDVFYAK